MKPKQKPDNETDWQKTPYANLLRYNSSLIYFARIRINGKLIRRSLKTKTLSVAKLRLSDLEKEERAKAKTSAAVLQGKMTFGNALTAYKQQLKNDPTVKSSTVEYYEYRAQALLKSWPDLGKTDVSKISHADCKSWSAKNAKSTSSSSHNHTVSLLRNVFKLAVEAGARYDNPAMEAKRVKEHTKKKIRLPESEQFEKLIQEVRNSGSGFAKPAADLMQFLAYGGFRKSEAKNITWEDCDFRRGKIVLRGDPETGLKRRSVGEFREVPMIPEMRGLLEKMKGEQPNATPTQPVMRVFECQKSMNTACEKLGITRLTHHDLRHLFATRCIESGVDIPTVSRWLGHKDGGALAMKTYGHLRDQHSITMAQKVIFAEPTHVQNVVALTNSVPERQQSAPNGNSTSAAHAKAKYSYPWWASSNPLEIFLGQVNEPVQIVSPAKYLEAAKIAMGREVFEQELSEPQSLLEEFTVRVGEWAIEKLKAKMLPSTKEKAA